MRASDIMTARPACCTPDATVEEATRLMQANDCGCIPVVEDTETNRLIGVVTDRDVALRAVAQGRGPETKVREVMTTEPRCCGPDDDVRDLERVMEEQQVRRVPVIDRAGCCMGIVAQADLALAEDRGLSDREVGRVVERISEPSAAPRRSQYDGDRLEAR